MGEPGRNIPPTRKRLQEARKRGNVLQLRDLLKFVSLTSGMIAILWLIPLKISKITFFAKQIFLNAGTVNFNGADLSIIWLWVREGYRVWLEVAIVVCIPVFLLTVLTGWLTTGTVFSFTPIQPQIDRINPFKGFGRLFSMDRVWSSIKDVFTIGLVAVAGIFIFSWLFSMLPEFAKVKSVGLLGEVLIATGKMFFKLTLLCIFPIIIMDLIYARHSYIRKLFMTPQELKKEIRETEGDPSIKGRRQKLHREIAMQRMLEDIKKAKVVITNPEHIAVALEWEEEKMDAPSVVARGMENIAQRIIYEARKLGIPVIRDECLARELGKLEVGEEIPEELYEPVAKILKLLESER